MWKLLIGLVRIVRPLNCVMFFAGTSVGGILAAGSAAFEWPYNKPLFLAALSATLVGASGNVLNDVYDVEIDRLNRPGRPLPAGLLSPQHARILWAVLAIAGLTIAFRVSWVHAGIAAASISLLFGYSARLKSTWLVGNVVVSVVVAFSLVYGSLSLSGAGPAVPAAIFAFLATLAREVIKDVEDLYGDRVHDSASLAVKSGPGIAARLAAVILLITVSLIPVPFVLFDYSGLYLMSMLIAAALLLAAAWTALRTDVPDSARGASRWTKLAMVAGLAALAGAGIGPA